MPVGISSAARNLFLLGSSGADVVTNFFKAIDQSSGSDDGYITTGLGVGEVDQAYLGQPNYNEYHLSGTKTDPNSKIIGWVDKRQEDGTLDWNVEVNETGGSNVLLNDLYLDANHTGLDGDHEVIVCGSAGSVPFVSKYDKDGAIIWSGTSQTADITYNGVTTSSEAADGGSTGYEGAVYACGNTDINGSSYAVVEKFSGATGTPDWGKSFTIQGSDVCLHAIDTQPRGNYVIAAGYLQDINNNFKGYFAKINSSNGEVIWDRTLELTDRDWGTIGAVEINDVCVDDNGFIYVVGSQFNAVSGFSAGFICKYTPEGNMLWQKETAIGGSRFDPTTSTVDTLLRWRYNRVRVDTQTGQIIILGSYHEASSDEYGVLIKYSSSGKKIFERIIESTETSPPEFGTLTHPQGGMALDADPSFYYVLFTDQELNTGSLIPNKYTFGKVSSSGNGLGAFSYDTGDTNTIEYLIHDIGDRIGRLSDGSVRNDTSDLATNILNPTKIMFDDLATPITNKKRQMDRAGDFVVGGSPSIRTLDNPDLNLLGDTILSNELNTIEVANEIKITPADSANGDQFGYSVAVGNDKIVVGAFGDDDDGSSSGSIYIFDLDGTNQIKVTASDGAASDLFGRQVAVGSNKIVVGAYNDGDNGAGSGSVYVYDMDGSNELKITPSDGAADDNFGIAVAVGEGKIVVGAPRNDDPNNSGCVYVYNLDGTGETKITASDATFSQFFGEPVAVGNGKIAVGSINQEVYLYDLDGSNEIKIEPSDPGFNTPDENFGNAFAIANRRIFISASRDDDNGVNSGTVYVYNLDGTGETKLYPSDTAAGDEFGYSIAAGNDKLIVGNANQEVYVYDIDADKFSNELKITASDSAANDNFGIAVAIEKAMVVGANFVNANNTNQVGAVYIYPITYSATSADQSNKGNDGVLIDVRRNAAGYWDFQNQGVTSGGQYIETSFPNDAIANGDANSEYTLEAWINVRTSQGTTTSADAIMGHNTDRGVGMQVGISNGNPRVNYGARFTSNFYGLEFNYNEWRHVVLTRDGTNGPIAYENGVEVNRTNSGFDLDVEDGFTPGNFNLGYCGPRIAGYFDGLIGEARVYTRALSAQAVFQNYNASKFKYINELPETSPKIGPGIVYGNNLLLNYDFSNGACVNRRTVRDRDITVTDADDYLNRHELESTELVIYSPLGDKGDFFSRALDSADGIIATSDPIISHDFWFNGISSSRETPGGEVYLYTFGEAVDNISSDNSSYEAELIATIRPPASYWNRGVAETEGALSIGDGVVVFSGYDDRNIDVVESVKIEGYVPEWNSPVNTLNYVVISDYSGNVTQVIQDPNHKDTAKQLTPTGYNIERLDIQQGIWMRNYIHNYSATWGRQVKVYDKKIYVSDHGNEKVYVYTLEGALLTSITIPESESDTPDVNGNQERQEFGYTIAANDGILAIGAPYDNDGDYQNDRMGSVYLFDTENLAYIRKITPNANIDFGNFGELIEIGHNRIVIGQPQSSMPRTNLYYYPGHVEMFDYNGQYIENLDTVNGIDHENSSNTGASTSDVEYLGGPSQSSFAITEKYVFIGYGDTGRGQVNVYDRVTGAHQEVMNPRLPLGETSGNYGRQMTLATNGYDQKLIVGNTKSEGKLYYYDLTKREVGTKIKNLSSSSHTGTLNGGAFVDTANGHLDLDGSATQELEFGSTDWGGALSIEMWIKTRETAQEIIAELVATATNHIGSDVGFRITRGGNLSNELRFGFRGNVNFNSGFTFTNNQWEHFVITFDDTDPETPSGFNSYKNGSSGTVTDGGTTVLSGTFTTNKLLRHDMEIGEFRIYDRELTASEVSKNYNATRARYGV